MAALRSFPIFSGVVSGTSVVDLYTVPTGKLLILKFVTVQEVSGSSCDAQLRLSTFGAFFVWNLLAYGTAGSRAVGDFWVAIAAGVKLQAKRTTSGDITLTASGSLLTV